MQNVLISAGEASGDLHAANLVKELKLIDESVQVTAMGGDKLRAAGANVIIDCAELAVVGLFEILVNYRKIKRALDQLAQIVVEQKPDLLILVDYQEFNWKLATIAKKHGVKVLFYVGPQVWAWRPKRVYKIKQKVDMMAVLFPFEVEFYEKAGVPVKFVGNPLVDEVKANADKKTLLKTYKLSNSNSDSNQQSISKIVGLFPGSRRGEIKRILPVQLKSARRLKQQDPNLVFVLAVASTLKTDELKDLCNDYADLTITFIQDSPYNIMSCCDAIIAASGTATLEIALMGIPFTITYQISPFSYAILKRMITIKHVGLVNIVAEKKIVNEYIQKEATSENISAEISRLLNDDNYRQTMLNELAKVKQKLGCEGGSKIIAQLAFDML